MKKIAFLGLVVLFVFSLSGSGSSGIFSKDESTVSRETMKKIEKKVNAGAVKQMARQVTEAGTYSVQISNIKIFPMKNMEALGMHAFPLQGSFEFTVTFTSKPFHKYKGTRWFRWRLFENEFGDLHDDRDMPMRMFTSDPRQK